MSYLSLVFSRKREPSLEAAEKIAASLRMGLEEFLLALRGHVVKIKVGWRGGKQGQMRKALVASQLR